MTRVIEILPELTGYEQDSISRLIKDLDSETAHLFANAYRARRKDPQLILLLCLLGFLGIAGVHRFVVDQIGMGIIYFLTAGLCFIGTIVDIINYKNFAYEYNIKQAQEIIYNLNKKG